MMLLIQTGCMILHQWLYIVERQFSINILLHIFIYINFLLILNSSGPNRGHYITIVKSYGYWLLFDDDIIEVIINNFLN